MTSASHARHGAGSAALAGLSPGYFGMVMATGIVSIGARLLGMPSLAQALFWLNLFAFALCGC
jgi:hypothetical protein